MLVIARPVAGKALDNAVEATGADSGPLGQLMMG